MQLHSIETGFFKLDGGAMFGVVPKTLWNTLNPADANNMCTWSMRCLLVEDGDRLTLIDNGIGDKQDAKFFSHYYLHGEDTLNRSLAARGFHRDDITDVILTHLHFDHCGGSVIRDGDRLLPAFRNARFWSNRQHWATATSPNAREKASFLKENILPIQESGQLRFAEEHADEFPPGITLRHVFGHTEAMMLPQIRYKEQTLVFMADLIPSAAHIPIPYVMAYDMFPLTTLQEKAAFLTEAQEGQYLLFFEHDPSIECCSLAATEKGIRKKEAIRLKDL